MSDNLQTMLNNDSLETLLRSNLSCHLGQSMTQETLHKITQQIIESIDYIINQQNNSL